MRKFMLPALMVTLFMGSCATGGISPANRTKGLLGLFAFSPRHGSSDATSSASLTGNPSGLAYAGADSTDAISGASAAGGSSSPTSPGTVDVTSSASLSGGAPVTPGSPSAPVSGHEDDHGKKDHHGTGHTDDD